MDQKISELNAAGAISTADLLAIVQAGITKNVALNVLAVFLQPYVTGAGASGMQFPNASNVLPNPTATVYASIVGAGTFTWSGGSLTTTGLLNVIGTNGTAWVLIKAVDTTSLLSKSEYIYGGKFATTADANAAILNSVVNGANLRDGKRVDIGTAGSYVQHWWKGGFADENLIPCVDIVDLLNAEIARDTVSLKSYGTQLAGTADDTLNSTQFKYNSNSKFVEDANGYQLKCYIGAVGTVELWVGTVSGTGFLNARMLGTFTASVIGQNVFTVSGKVFKGETPALKGTAKLKFGTSGVAGNQFQSQTATAAAASQTIGSYYAIEVINDIARVKPLSRYQEKSTFADDLNKAITAALAYELARTGITSKSYGTDLVGINTDALSNTQFKYNLLSALTEDATMVNVNVNLSTAGVVELYAGTSTAGGFISRKMIGSYNLPVDLSSFAVNEPMFKGETYAWKRPSGGVAVIKWGTGGAAGDKFQAQTSAAAATGGGFGSFYSTKADFQIFAAKPLDVYTPVTRTAVLETQVNSIVAPKTLTLQVYPTGVQTQADKTAGIFRGATGIAGETDVNLNALQRAINYASNSYAYGQQFEVILKEPVTITEADLQAADVDGYLNYATLYGKKNITVKAANNKYPYIFGNFSGVSALNYANVQIIREDNCPGCSVSDLYILGKNCRYPIHRDSGALNGGLSAIYANMTFRHDGNTGTAAAWQSWLGHGVGVAINEALTYNDCKFISTKDGYQQHDNYSNFENATVRHRRSVFTISDSSNSPDNIYSVNQFGNVGSKGLTELIDCQFNGGKTFLYKGDNNKAGAYARVIGHGNGAVLFSNILPSRLKNIRITSNSTGPTSTVRFNTADALYAAIIKGVDLGSAASETGVVQRNGYESKDGFLDVQGWAVGGAPNYNDSNSSIVLGPKIGDCSTTNKTLNVVVDGVNIPVVFNQNYTAMTDVDIVADINTKLGSAAVASLWHPAGDYYLEFTDVNHVMLNDSAVTIKKGAGVVLNSTGVRLSNGESSVYGVAIDDIPPKGTGRVIRRCYVSTNQTDRFAVKLKAGTVIAKDAYLKCDNGEFTISATPTNVQVLDQRGLKVLFS